MKTRDAIRHFGGVKALADQLGIWPQVVYQWGEYPPTGRQYEIEVKTAGALRAERGEPGPDAAHG